MNICTWAGVMESWVCCHCETFNDFNSTCEYCGHERCELCESEIDEDDYDFFDVILQPN